MNFNTNKKAKLVLFDLDGTIVNKRHEISSNVISAFNRLKELNIPYGIASGRAPYQCKQIINQLQIKDFCSFMSGGLVVNPSTNEILIKHEFDNNLILNIYNWLINKDLYFEFYYENGYRISKKDVRHDLHFSYSKMSPLGFISDSNFNSVLKICLILSEEKDWEINEELIANFPTIGQKIGKGSAHPGVGFANITSTNNALENAYNKITEVYKIDPSEILSIGDSESDLVFIKNSGFGVAMGNAEQIIKNHAKFTTLSVEEDGAAIAFNNLV